jgi:cytidylate kinase
MSIITLTGDLGSGKSTVSAILCRQLGYEYVYTGAIQRKIAERYGMNTTELNQYAETHPEIDEEIDNTFRALANAGKLIVDSRLAWFFLPGSFKIFLQTDLKVAASRIAADKQRKGEHYPDVEEAARQIALRKASENKRYMELYHANCADLTQFDLVIDTSSLTPEAVADDILRHYREWETAHPSAIKSKSE